MLTKQSECFFFDQISFPAVRAGFSSKPINLNLRSQSIPEFKKSLAQLSALGNFLESYAAFFDQIHGTDFFHLRQETKFSGLQSLAEHRLIRADAAFTSEIDLPILIFTADCAPLFVTAKSGEVIGLLHVGWKGASAGIISKVLNAMSASYDLRPQDFFLMIGPLIRSCCYEVGLEFKKYFPGNVTTREKKLFFNLPQFIGQNLNRLGISNEQILDAGICTGCDLRFHSYRREGEQSGRMASFIVKKGF